MDRTEREELRARAKKAYARDLAAAQIQFPIGSCHIWRDEIDRDWYASRVTGYSPNNYYKLLVETTHGLHYTCEHWSQITDEELARIESSDTSYQAIIELVGEIRNR